MKKNLLLVLILAGGSLLASASGGTDIRVAPGTTRAGSIQAFKSSLDIGGKVADGVFLVGGSLRLSGEIAGDVICVGARVEITDGAVIGRDLIVIGGRVSRAPGCRIHGDFYYVRSREDLKKITRTLLPFLPESGGLNFIRVSKIFLWFMLALLALAIMPAQVSRAAAMLRKSPLHFAALGFLALLVFVFALLVFVILSLVLIGIPLLFALLALYFLVLIFGRTVVFYFVGERIASFLKLKNNAIIFVILGIVVYSLLKVLPWFGAPLLIGMDIFAIGISVGFFLKRKKSAI